jgi:hypothetical protein
MTPFERRVQRLAVIVSVLAIIAAVLGMIPGGMASITPIGDATGELSLTAPIVAGGWTLVAFAVIHGLIARHVYRHPTRANTWRWFGAALVSVPVGVMVWARVEHSFAEQSIDWRQAGEAMGAFMGAVFVLLLLVLPIVALYSDHVRREVAPSARIVAS